MHVRHLKLRAALLVALKVQSLEVVVLSKANQAVQLEQNVDWVEMTRIILRPGAMKVIRIEAAVSVRRKTRNRSESSLALSTKTTQKRTTNTEAVPAQAGLPCIA